MVRVKICGITNLDDALAAVEFGADALGFVFYEKSPRAVSADKAREIIERLPPLVTTVGVFVNEQQARVYEIIRAAGLDTIQLHGDEPPEMCSMWPRVIKAFRVRNMTDLEVMEKYRVSAYLLDAYSGELLGGTGQVFNWDIAVEARKYGRIVLAGGLTPANVEKAVRFVHPYAVDVSSGVEKERGVKDHKKVREFIKNAKAVV